MAYGTRGDRRRGGARRAWPAILALVAAALPACGLGTPAPATSGPRPGTAATSPPPAAAPGPATVPSRVTVLMLDMSGSMAANDPNQIRCAAARTFVGLS